MVLHLKGHIKTIKSSEDRMGDYAKLVTFEVVGDFKALHDYEKHPLDITVEVEDIA